MAVVQASGAQASAKCQQLGVQGVAGGARPWRLPSLRSGLGGTVDLLLAGRCLGPMPKTILTFWPRASTDPAGV
eukprot:6714610-Pyramimonas_sp.AAC.1